MSEEHTSQMGLWFVDQAPPEKSIPDVDYREGDRGLLYACSVRAVGPGDVQDAVREMRSSVGAAVSTMADALSTDGVTLPPDLAAWGVPERPAEEIGPATITALAIDDAVYLALSWEYGDLSAMVVVAEDREICVVVPSAEASSGVRLETTDHTRSRHRADQP